MKRIALLMLLASSVNADMISPSHNCLKPAAPSLFDSESDRLSFRWKADVYRQCLSQFINEQERQSRVHADAARAAGTELRQFGD